MVIERLFPDLRVLALPAGVLLEVELSCREGQHDDRGVVHVAQDRDGVGDRVHGVQEVDYRKDDHGDRCERDLLVRPVGPVLQGREHELEDEDSFLEPVGGLFELTGKLLLPGRGLLGLGGSDVSGALLRDLAGEGLFHGLGVHCIFPPVKRVVERGRRLRQGGSAAGVFPLVILITGRGGF